MTNQCSRAMKTLESHLSMVCSRDSGVVMGGNDKSPVCLQFHLMNKVVKCIVIFRSFGRFPFAAKSQDTKNMRTVQSRQGPI